MSATDTRSQAEAQVPPQPLWERGFSLNVRPQVVDPRTMQQWIGHRSLATTLKYAHISPTIDRDSASANHGTRMAPAFRAHEKGTRNEAIASSQVP